jgi:hypothetical protein
MIPSDTFCGECNRSISDEASDDRKPCPDCLSLKRRYELSSHEQMHATATAELTVITYPQTLLTTALDLLEREQYGIAIVVAHMACEVAAERSMAEAFQAKSLTHLEEPILAFVNGFNLATPRIRELYSALTGDEIQKQPFWQAFKTSATLRNNIVHNGKIAARSDAESSITAATAFVVHLKK